MRVRGQGPPRLSPHPDPSVPCPPPCLGSHHFWTPDLSKGILYSGSGCTSCSSPTWICCKQVAPGGLLSGQCRKHV